MFSVLTCVVFVFSVCLIVFGTVSKEPECDKIPPSDITSSELKVVCGSVSIILGIVHFGYSFFLQDRRCVPNAPFCDNDTETSRLWKSCAIVFMILFIFAEQLLLFCCVFIFGVTVNYYCIEGTLCEVGFVLQSCRCNCTIIVLTLVFDTIIALCLVIRIFFIIRFCSKRCTLDSPSQQPRLEEIEVPQLNERSRESARNPQKRKEDELKRQIQKKQHQKRSNTTRIHPLSVTNVVDSDFVEWI